MNLGQFIKQQRIKNGYTQEQLAKIIGKNKAFISRIESNKVKSLKNDTIEPLANALNIPVISLFEGFDANGNKLDHVEEISPDEFLIEVKGLIGKVTNISDSEKLHIVSTLEFICSDKK